MPTLNSLLLSELDLNELKQQLTSSNVHYLPQLSRLNVYAFKLNYPKDTVIAFLFITDKWVREGKFRYDGRLYFSAIENDKSIAMGITQIEEVDIDCRNAIEIAMRIKQFIYLSQTV